MGNRAADTKDFTSTSRADGRYDKSDLVYIRKRDVYRCPAGEYAIRRFTSIEKGMAIYKYWSCACPRCALRSKFTPAHTDASADGNMIRCSKRCRPAWIVIRRECHCGVRPPSTPLEPSNHGWELRTSSVEPLPKVSAQMSLHVLAYNLKRVMRIMGTGALMEVLRT